jgi:hypothetical protein
MARRSRWDEHKKLKGNECVHENQICVSSAAEINRMCISYRIQISLSVCSVGAKTFLLDAVDRDKRMMCHCYMRKLMTTDFESDGHEQLE